MKKYYFLFGILIIISMLVSCGVPGGNTPSLTVKIINFPAGNGHHAGALLNGAVAYSSASLISGGKATISGFQDLAHNGEWPPYNGELFSVWVGIDMDDSGIMTDPGDYQGVKNVTINGATTLTFDGATDFTIE